MYLDMAAINDYQLFEVTLHIMVTCYKVRRYSHSDITPSPKGCISSPMQKVSVENFMNKSLTFSTIPKSDP